MPSFLAIDQSTSATKALIFDQEARLLAQASREHRQLYPKPGWVEHDLDEIWSHCLETCREALAGRSDRAGEVASVSIANQRETVGFWDRETGRPLRKAIVWQDRRGVALCRQIEARGLGASVREKTGLPADAYFSASKVAWALREDERVREAAANGRLCVGTIDAFLIFRLTNGKTFATDATNASRTLFMDARTGQWDDGLLELFGARRESLPQIRSPFSEFGQTDLAGTLPRAVPIRGVMGDSQASLLGHGGSEPGDAKATFGTGTSVMLNIGSEYPAGGSEQPIALAWRRGQISAYACEGLVSYSAATLQWLRDQLGILADPSESEAMAAELESNEGVYFVPAFGGLMAPVQAPEARAAIVGLTAQSDRRHVARAALEAIAYQIDDCLGGFRHALGVSPAQLFADGGPTRNRWLMQFCADVIGLPIFADNVAALSPRGALFAGWIAEGRLEGPESIRSLPADRVVYQPSGDKEEVARWKEGWRRAVGQTVA